jgi:hypothetical protein
MRQLAVVTASAVPGGEQLQLGAGRRAIIRSRIIRFSPLRILPATKSQATGQPPGTAAPWPASTVQRCRMTVLGAATLRPAPRLDGQRHSRQSRAARLPGGIAATVAVP